MKKKIVSLLLTIVMVMALVPELGVSAEVTYVDAEGWSASTLVTPSAHIYNFAVGESYSGNRALHVNYVRPATATSDWLRAEYTDGPAVKAATTYVVTYYAKYGTGNPTPKLGNVAVTMTSETPDDAEKAANGWLKYTGQVTTDNTAKLQFVFQYANGDYYFDDITVTESGAANPSFVCDFEPEAQITYSDLTGSGWTASTSATVPTYEAKIANGIGYSDNTSLYVNYTRPSNPSGIWMNLINSTIPETTVVAGKKYILTYYAKPGNNGNVTAKLGNGIPVDNWSHTVNGVTPEDPEKADEGWLKFSGEITAANSSKLTLVFGYTGGEWYFDDFTVEEVVKQVGYTNAEDWSGLTLNTENVPHVFNIAVGESYSGNRALHVNYVRPSDAKTDWLRVTYDNCPKIKSDTQYTVTYYAKYGTGNPSLKLGNVVITMTEGIPEDETKAADGWKKYSGQVTATSADKLQFVFQYANGDYYFDDITIVEQGVSDPVLFYDFESGENHDAAIEVFDGEELVNILDESLSGKTLTAKAVLINNDLDEALSGQVIFALYEGDELKSVELSELTTGILKADGAVEIKTELTMPVLTAETEGAYRIKAFLWDSLTELTPLINSLNIN